MSPDHVPGGLLQHRVLDDVAAVRRRAVRPVRRPGHHDLAGGAVPGPPDRSCLHVPAGTGQGNACRRPGGLSTAPPPHSAPTPEVGFPAPVSGSGLTLSQLVRVGIATAAGALMWHLVYARCCSQCSPPKSSFSPKHALNEVLCCPHLAGGDTEAQRDM